jgi:glycosyltransferase involved in cell wall biosynthesis
MANVVEENVENLEIHTVSIVTVTQYARHECLSNLERLIQKQIYQNIVEWVIVEGSKTEADAEANALRISELKIELPINYIPFRSNQHLSDLRNIGNEACIGEIIVCMDDDDYYPPTRVSHAVHRLTNSDKMIAGCSKAYIYFYRTGQFFQFKSFGSNHSTNNCLAYKREYLLSHQHLHGLDKAEESSFTDGFKEPMEQLDPMKTIVISGHDTNTVDKSKVSPEMMTELNGTALILEYIPLPILLKMEKIFEM